jgi:hypothetical protein
MTKYLTIGVFILILVASCKNENHAPLLFKAGDRIGIDLMHTTFKQKLNINLSTIYNKDTVVYDSLSLNMSKNLTADLIFIVQQKFTKENLNAWVSRKGRLCSNDSF